jgi:hypothetical protein
VLHSSTLSEAELCRQLAAPWLRVLAAPLFRLAGRVSSPSLAYAT